MCALCVLANSPYGVFEVCNYMANKCNKMILCNLSNFETISIEWRTYIDIVICIQTCRLYQYAFTRACALRMRRTSTTTKRKWHKIKYEYIFAIHSQCTFLKAASAASANEITSSTSAGRKRIRISTNENGKKVQLIFHVEGITFHLDASVSSDTKRWSMLCPSLYCLSLGQTSHPAKPAIRCFELWCPGCGVCNSATGSDVRLHFSNWYADDLMFE